MTDLATIQIKVETTGVEQADAKLKSVSNTAKAAETATTNAAKALGMSGYQYKQLGFQVNDVVTSLASGAPAMQVLAQQGGQVYQVLGMGPGGVGGALKEITASVGRFAASGPGAFAAAALSVGAYAFAVERAQSEQDKLEKQLAFGLGRFAGVTADSFREITDAAASAAGVSRGVARDVGMIFAQTGQVGGEMIGNLIGLTRRYAAVTGKEMTDAAQDIAKAFSDPAKGAEQMAAALGASTDFLSLRTREYIRALQTQGEQTKAQGVLFNELATGPMPKLETRVKDLATLWERVKTAAGNAGDSMVRSMVTTPADRSRDLQRDLLGLNSSSIYNIRRSNIQQELGALYAEIDDLDAKLWADQKARATEGVAAFTKAMQDKADAHQLELRALMAKTDVERAAVAGQQAYNEAMRAGLGDQQARIMAIYAEERAMAGLTAGLNDQIKAYQNQASALSAGAGVLNSGGGTAAARARMQEEAQMAKAAGEIAAAQQRADQATGAEKERLGQTVAGLRDQYNKLGEAIYYAQKAQDSMTAANINNSLGQRLEMLQLETKLVGASTEARYRSIEALKTEHMIANQMIFPNSAAADSIRMMSKAVVDQQIKLDRAKASVDDYAKSLAQIATAAVGAGSALQTAFAAQFAGGGGAQSGTFSIYSTNYANEVANYNDWQKKAQMENSTQQSALRNTISMLEKNVESMKGRWDNYQPSAYAEKNPLLFYDFQQGSHFTEAERTQISKMEEQLATAQKQLMELERIAQLLQMPVGQALRDPLTFNNGGRNLGPSIFDNYVNGYGALVNKDLMGIYPGFATGGSFMVGGNGGTDTTPVRFMATKGERVTVETPAQQRSSAQGQTIIHKEDQRTIHIHVNAPEGGSGDSKLAADRFARDVAERVRRMA